jgi:hypothetical protein
VRETSRNNPQQPKYWVTIPDRCGYCLAFVDDRRVLVLAPISETGIVSLRVAGFYLEDWKLVGERRDRLAMRIQLIPKAALATLEPRLRDALPPDLRNLPFAVV